MASVKEAQTKQREPPVGERYSNDQNSEEEEVVVVVLCWWWRWR